MQVRKQQLELDMEQQTCSKSGKEYVKVVYCHPAYLTYMQSTSWETLDWKKHKLANMNNKFSYSLGKVIKEKIFNIPIPNLFLKAT